MKVIETRQGGLNLLAAASHDLRQPVQALGLFVSALRAASQQGGLDAQSVDEICLRMRASLRGMGRTLDSLLTLARSETGTTRASLRPFHLQEALTFLEEEFQVIAADKKIELRVAPTKLWVHTDDHLLGRILGNLLSNALRYTAKGKVLVGCRPRGAEVEVQVWDTGIGIPPDQQAEVFREGFRASNAGELCDRSNGLGLGLAIVQRTAALLGASLELRSEPGRGSMFSIRLPREVDHPRRRFARSQPPEAAGARPSNRRSRIRGSRSLNELSVA